MLAGNTPEAGDIVSTESSKAGSVTSSVVDLLSQADTAAPAKVKPEMDVFGVIQSSTSEARAEAAAVTPQGLASDSQSTESLFGDRLPPAHTPISVTPLFRHFHVRSIANWASSNFRVWATFEGSLSDSQPVEAFTNKHPQVATLDDRVWKAKEK